MEKYKRQEVSPVEEENERDETYQASNPQIDSSRTHLNYHITLTYQQIIFSAERTILKENFTDNLN